MVEHRPDKPIKAFEKYGKSLFLAGSIEMGKAENWQKVAIQKLLSHTGVIYNPRVATWDTEVEQDSNDIRLVKQVTWEQAKLESAQYVLVNLLPDTLSPITLHELGQLCKAGKKCVVVACPRGFWRRGNVQICCALHGMFLYDNLHDAITHLSILFHYEDER